MTLVYPEDFYDWSLRGGDSSEFDCPGMHKAVIEKVKEGKARYLVLDFPFGRDHHRFKDLIDLSVFVDTPLDVAMARRITRDFLNNEAESAESRLQQLKEDLSHYVTKARFPYLDTYRHRDTADLVLDGWQSLESLRDQIVDEIKKGQQ